MPVDLDAAIDQWRSQLLDTSRRNRLINFKTGGRGGVAFRHPGPDDLWHRLVLKNGPVNLVWKRDLVALPEPEPQPEPPLTDGDTLTLPDPDPESTGPSDAELLELCLRSPKLRAEHVLTDMADDALHARLKRLALNAREALSEQGVTILYLAFGFLRWFESDDSNEEVCSPLLLVPVRMWQDDLESPWRLQAVEEELLPNHSLAQRLSGDFNLKLPLPADDEDTEQPEWRAVYLERVRQAVAHLKRWQVEDGAALGAFSFQKLAMWQDLGDNRARIASHPLCRAVAGDAAALPQPPDGLPGDRELDEKVSPQETYHILDADSSQQVAIEAVLRGANLVLDGPPGTGKSQTIANIIAGALARHKTVLFVSEKAAALEVVHRRLQSCDLADFCLVCHGARVNRREVLAELGRCLGLPPEEHGDPTDDLKQLAEARQKLNEYVRALHERRPALGRSAFQVHGELARLHAAARSLCPIPDVLARDESWLRQVTRSVARLPDCQPVLDALDRHPWRGCKATTDTLALRQELAHHLERLADASRQANEAAGDLHRHGLLHAGPTLGEWRKGLERAKAVLTCPAVPEGWFRDDARECARAAVELATVTADLRRTCSRLPEFDVARLSPASLQDLPGVKELLARLRSGPRDNPRPWLTALADTMASLAALARSAEATAAKVAELLKLSLPPQSVKGLPSLAELAQDAVRAAGCPKSWWDAARRRELETVIGRAAEESRTGQDLRVGLVARLSPVAFAPESGSVAREALRYRFFLFRLWPRWWKLKATARSWYLHEPPPTSALLDDLAKLAEYHRKAEFCRQVEGQYAADLLRGEDGRPDWEQTLEGLRAVGRLEERLKKTPTVLKALRTSSASLDREALTAAAAMLQRDSHALIEKLEILKGDWASADGEPSLPAEQAAWLDRRAEQLRFAAASLERLEAALLPGRSLRAADLPARLDSLIALGKARERIARLALVLWPGGSPDRLEETDWTDLAKCGQSLLAILDDWRGPLSPPVVAFLIDPASRPPLAECVRRNEEVLAGGFEPSWAFLTTLFDPGQPISTGLTLDAAPLAQLTRWFIERSADVPRVQEWVLFKQVESELRTAGLETLLQEVLDRKVPAAGAVDAFRARFYRAWVDAVCEAVPTLGRFRTETHERLAERFRELDRRAIAWAPARLRQDLLSRPGRPRAVVDRAPETSELGVLLREVNKQRRHLPLRRLFSSIPDLLLRLKPCLMTSPLAVSTYLESPELHFDLVIFDEASQVRPHDAVCAIYRGRQVIVSGDQKQLPPTAFFERATGAEEGSDEPADDGDLSDFESILDVCCSLGLPRRRLRWHYRSRREALIAFSNYHFYANELVTFPSARDAGGEPAVSFSYLPEGRWTAGPGGGFNAVEARTVAERVLAHARESPGRSLGVIAFSQRQQLRILDELERLRKAHPELESFFKEDRDDPFFVKNLENVQGDERDAIFLCVGYGPDAQGRVYLRFGPLNRAGGQRRLNVAVTRARERMTVFSSLRASDIDLSRSGAEGVRLVRAFLDYAERGPAALEGGITGVAARGFESLFEQEVFDELTRRGLTVHPQVGCGGYRIDLGIVDPFEPGRYLLGVECDGATYHSSATARDRDRLRQQVLQSLGWRVLRIWSPDWVRDREGQVRRVQAALKDARRATRADAPASDGDARASLPPPKLLHLPRDPLAALGYESIDDVDDKTLAKQVLRVLEVCGATTEEELIKGVVYRLGLKRTTDRMQSIVGEVLDTLIREGRLRRTPDARLTIAK